MFRALVFNTLVSAVAYFAVSLLGVLLVPLLVSTYGLAQFGLLTLSRVLLPTAGLGILDFGLTDITLKSIASGRADGNWQIARARVRALGVAAVVMGAGIGATIFTYAESVTTLLHVDPEHLQSFAGLIRVTALLLPLLFLGLVMDGVIKGFERFGAMRLLEVVGSAGYTGSAFLCAHIGASYDAIALAYLGWLAVRAVATMVYGSRLIVAAARDSGAPGALCEGAVFLREHGYPMFWGRLLSTLQHQSPALLIGGLLGPAAVGAFDMLMRLPRFAKIVLGLLNSALPPLAARLDVAGDQNRLRLIAETGYSLLPMVCWPVLSACSAFAGAILTVWLGESYRADGVWLALLFLVPAINTILGYQANALMMRIDFIRASNRIALAQTAVQFGISFALVSSLGEKAFVLGYALAPLMAFFVQSRLVFRQHRLGADYGRRFIGMSVVLPLMVYFAHLRNIDADIGELMPLAGGMLVWCLACWVLLPMLALSRSARERYLRGFRRLIGR